MTAVGRARGERDSLSRHFESGGGEEFEMAAQRKRTTRNKAAKKKATKNKAAKKKATKKKAAKKKATKKKAAKKKATKKKAASATKAAPSGQGGGESGLRRAAVSWASRRSRSG
jgi:hypothetical protein